MDSQMLIDMPEYKYDTKAAHWGLLFAIFFPEKYRCQRVFTGID